MLRVPRARFWVVLLGLAAAARAQHPVVDVATFERWMVEYSNWGRWGDDDELGTLNLITPEKRVEAARLVREGIVVSLAHELRVMRTTDNPRPLNFAMTSIGSFSSDRLSIRYHGFAHSHLDALCHVSHDGKMYNGVAADLITESGCEKMSIRAFADGIFTRGVLIDIPAVKDLAYLEPGTAIFPEDLDAWANKTGVEVKPGDAVLIRTGKWARLDAEGPWSTSQSLAGLHVTAVKWLRDRDVAIVGTDGAGDVLPQSVDGHSGVHKLLLVAMGTSLFDNLDLEALAKQADKLGRYEFLFTTAPLIVPGGTGSPLNPTAAF